MEPRRRLLSIAAASAALALAIAGCAPVSAEAAPAHGIGPHGTYPLALAAPVAATASMPSRTHADSDPGLEPDAS